MRSFYEARPFSSRKMSNSLHQNYCVKDDNAHYSLSPFTLVFFFCHFQHLQWQLNWSPHTSFGCALKRTSSTRASTLSCLIPLEKRINDKHRSGFTDFYEGDWQWWLSRWRDRPMVGPSLLNHSLPSADSICFH